MTKELSKPQETAVTVPEQPRRGFESTYRQEDLIIPFAKVFQGNPTEYEKYPNAKPGQIISTLTGTELPKRCIPIKTSLEWIRYNPRDPKHPDFDKAFKSNEMIWKSSDPNDPRVIKEAAWRPNNEPSTPLALAFRKYLCLFEGESIPVVVSFYKTSWKNGCAMNTILISKQGDMFKSAFNLSTKMVKTDQYSYYVLNSTYAGNATEDEYKRAEVIYNQFKDVQIAAEHADFTE